MHSARRSEGAAYVKLGGAKAERVGLESVMPRVFLSHSWDDKAIVRRVADDLVTAGAEVWLDERELLPGYSFVTGISEGLASAEFVLLFVSEAFLKSRWAEIETTSALRQSVETRDASVVPILLEDVWNRTSPLLRQLIYVDLRDRENIIAYRQALALIIATITSRKSAPLPRLTRKPSVLVTGSRVSTGGGKDFAVASALGFELGSAQVNLLTGVAEGVDSAFAEAAAKAIRNAGEDPRRHLTAWGGRGRTPAHGVGRILQSQFRTREEGIPELVTDSDCAFLVGGGKNTTYLGTLLLLEGKVVLPIAATLGAAADCYSLVSARYDRFFRGQLERSRFQDLADQTLSPTEMAKACKDLLELLFGTIAPRGAVPA
jgi:hypothetical protein